jgi:hypothetical protein
MWEEGNFNKRFLANLCGKVESPNGRRWKFYHPRGISSTLKSSIFILIPDVHRRWWPDDDEQSLFSHRTSRSIFQFHRWMECPEWGLIMDLFLFVIADNKCHCIHEQYAMRPSVEAVQKILLLMLPDCCVLCVVRGDRHCGGGKLVSVRLYKLRHM